MNHLIRQQRWFSYSLALLLTIALSWGVTQPALAAPVATTIRIPLINPRTLDPAFPNRAIDLFFELTSAGASVPFTGIVTFTDSEGNNLCTHRLTASNSILRFGSYEAYFYCTMGPFIGERTVTVTYSGDSNYSPSTSQPVHLTMKYLVNVAITAHTPDPSSVDQAVLVQYSVNLSSAGSSIPTPTGTVVVSDGVNSCSATVAAGQCSLNLETAGARTLTASYAGDNNFQADSTSVSHTVIGYPSTTNIMADSPDPSIQGQAVTVNYSVSAHDPSKGTPSGNVTVSDGVDSCTGTVAAGSCSLTLNTLGARTLTAIYTGDPKFAGSASAGEPHTVNAPDTTPPVITASGTKADGTPYTPGTWANQNVLVRFTCSDSESGIAVCPSDQVISPDGTFTAQGTARDNAGNTATASFGPIQIDKTKPVIAGSRSPAANTAGWNQSDVTVSFTCADSSNGSGLATNTVAGATVSTEGANQSITNSGACVDNAGNAADAVTVSGINLDKTAPTINAATTTQPNANGWYNRDVTVQFTCADNLAGVTNCPTDETLSSEGNAVAVTAQTITDLAGNSSAASNVVTVQLDKTAPVVTVTGVNNGASYILGSVPTAGCSTADALSGVATQATLTTTGDNANGSGSVTATCSGATDKAGNSATLVSATYSVIYNWTGFFQPVDNLPTVNTVNAGQAIPVKFSLGGDFALTIFAAGYPKVQAVACGGSSGGASPVEETVTAGNSSLQYDPATQIYTYVWKTDKSWAGSCRQLMVKLNDGSEQLAIFQFNGKTRSAGAEAEESAPIVTIFMPLINR